MVRAAPFATIISCGGGGITPTPPRRVESISVPSTLDLEAGETRSVAASLTISGDAPTTVTWQSLSPAIATVAARAGNEAGVTGVSAGVATVRATSTFDNTKSADVQVTVTNASVSTVTIDQTAPRVVRGRTLPLNATPKSSRGTAIAGRAVAWESLDQSIATIDQQGIVTGVAFGSVAIRATVDGVSATVALTVATGPVDKVVVTPNNPEVSRGGTVRLTVSLSDEGGNAVDPTGKAIGWAATNPSIVTIANDGTVTGVATGQTDVTATVDGKSGSTTVRVTDSPPATIVVSPDGGSVEEGLTLQLAAAVKDAGGRLLTLTPTWTSLDVPIATVSTTGLVTGVSSAASKARIVASLLASATTSIADTVLITVTPAAVASVTAQIAASRIEVGEKTQATAELRSATGVKLTGRAVNWTSSAPAVASVNATTGEVTGVAPGTANITAQVDGKIGLVPVQVAAAQPDRVEVQPSAVSISLGGTQSFSAAVRDSRGGLIAGCPIAWSASPTSIATVNNAGMVTAVGVGGPATITASCQSKQGTASVTVTQGANVSILGIYVGGTSTPASLNSISGTIDVEIGYNTGGTVELFVNNSTVGGSPTTVCAGTCKVSLNTAAFNQSTGAVTYQNGSKILNVRLTPGTGAPVSSPNVNVAFDNTNGFVASLVPNGSSAVDGLGRAWSGGAAGGATATLVPVIYTPGVTIATASVRLGAGPILADASPPFSYAFNATTYNGYSSSTAGDPLFITASTFSNGTTGPTGFLSGAGSSVRVDFLAPNPPGVAAMPTWVNAASAFPAVAGVSAGTDGGVGGVVTTVGVTTGALSGTGTTCFNGLTTVSSGGQLTEGVPYVGRAKSVDALGNQSDCSDLRPNGVAGASFRADFTPPTFSIATGPSNGAISSTLTPNFTLSPSDNGSGLGSNPARVSLEVFSGGTRTCVIGATSLCNAVAQPLTFSSHSGAAGFYLTTLRVADQAGNESAPVTRQYLVDATNPSSTAVTFASPLMGNGTYGFNFTATDNIALHKAVVLLSYGGQAPFAYDPPLLGASFGAPIIASVSTQAIVSGFVRCLNNAKASSIQVTVFDQAGLTSSNSTAIPAASVENCGSIGNVTLSSSPAWIANPNTISRSSGTTTLQAFVDVPVSTVGAPFQRVTFYQWDPASGYRSIGGTSSPTASQGATTRTWTYSLIWDPSNSTPTGSLPIIALFVDNDGDASGTTSTVTISP